MPPTSALASDAVPCGFFASQPWAYFSSTIRSLRITNSDAVCRVAKSLHSASSFADDMPWLSGVAVCQTNGLELRPAGSSAVTRPQKMLVARAIERMSRFMDRELLNCELNHLGLTKAKPGRSHSI